MVKRLQPKDNALLFMRRAPRRVNPRWICGIMDQKSASIVQYWRVAPHDYHSTWNYVSKHKKYKSSLMHSGAMCCMAV